MRSGKMVDNKKIEEEKRYTYPEILKKYFPKANEIELMGDESLLNKDLNDYNNRSNSN